MADISARRVQRVNNPGMCRKFKVELAVTVDAMAAFVKATYNLEGDGP